MRSNKYVEHSAWVAGMLIKVVHSNVGTAVGCAKSGPSLSAEALDLILNLEVCTMRVCVKLLSICPDLLLGTMLK